MKPQRPNDKCQAAIFHGSFFLLAVKSNTGKRELKKITADGNKLEGKVGLKAGDCIDGVWQKDRDGTMACTN
ncbi:hypothetical protein pdam_00025521 [Pocillopora damicornis]|uniref:Uncharacterized protein n=1 Tax=Pocillopora damicornis TaxID=46731 RepID=A0A3M6UAZ1_POCDA|nr:hypothetical protein pdam_00025521 [Pocillopora damicornis]